MDPYTNALYYFSDMRQSHPIALSSDLILDLFPIAWSGGHLARSDQPWPFVFLPGDRAWAKGVNGKWRRVQILDAGQPENYGNRFIIWYTASWMYEGVTFRKLFCPLEGNLKPDLPSIRTTLFEEGVHFQGTLWEDEAEELQERKSDACLIA